jgi:hypothetical protein
LGELVKCKTLKTIFQPKFSEMLDISGLQTGFQRGFPDKSVPQPRIVQASLLPQLLSPWPDLSGPLTGFQRGLSDMFGTQSDMSGLLLIFRFPSLSDSLPRFQGVFPDITGQLPRHARPSLAIKRLSLKTGLVRFSGRIPVRLAGHVLSPTRTSPGL